MNRWKDSLGIGASILCAIHCAATPILLAVLPNLSLTGWMASPWFHQAAAFFCVALVATSIWPAYKKHKDGRVLGFSSAGLALIFGSAFLFPADCCSTGACSGHTVSATSGVPEGHENCVFCAAKSKTAEDAGTAAGGSPGDSDSRETQIAGVSLAGLWNALLHWITPIGGGFLVIAHYLNMRRTLGRCGGSCGCHVKEEEVAVATEMGALSQAA
ncbi:MerC domain-containing protein [Pirellulaceae bacterium SH449]